MGGIALLAIVLAVAAINGGKLGGTSASTNAGTGIPTFTLPDPSSLTLTVTGDSLPLPGVVTDTGMTDTGVTGTGATDTGVTDTLQVFTDTTSSVPPATDTAPATTIVDTTS